MGLRVLQAEADANVNGKKPLGELQLTLDDANI
jgi:hypothetical protein